MAAPKSDQGVISDINIVPLVDIILVVLIIFMIASPADQQAKININLPEASSGVSVSDSQDPFQVSLNDEGFIFINGEMVSEIELKTKAESEVKKNGQVEGILTADKNLGYGEVVRIIDVIKSAGLKNLAISTTTSLE